MVRNVVHDYLLYCARHRASCASSRTLRAARGKEAMMMTHLLQRYRPVALLVVLALFIALPLLAPGISWLFPGLAVMSIAVFTVMYAAASTAWNIFSGYTGYLA